jgi:hypothetical protein
MTKKELTPKDKEEIDQIVAIFRLEGMEPPECAIEFLEMRATGELTGEKYRELIKKIALDQMTPAKALEEARKGAANENL